MSLMTDGLSTLASEIGERTAGPVADDVDREGRLPREAIDALRDSGLLASLVPSSWGGAGAAVAEMGEAVTALAQYCASSALVLAMHSIQVACLLGHAEPGTLDQLLPELLNGELLLASANSEVGLGGERRRSVCALEGREGGYRLRKQASTVSYGECADAVLATARRDPDSAANDQVLVVCRRPGLMLTPTGGWDTLGMRGTCSRPYLLEADVAPDMVVDAYGEIFVRTALPVSAVLLSSVWLGLAEAAARRAHRSVRAQARRQRAEQPDAPPPSSALRLAELGVVLHQLREVLAGGRREYERARDSDEVATLAFSGRMDNLQLASSTLVGDIVARAMAICGLGGYDNTSASSIGRISRDAAAAPLMVNNDRSLLATARTLLIRKEM